MIVFMEGHQLQLLVSNPRLIQSQLIDYVIYMAQERRVGIHAINANMAAIRKFYDTNYCVNPFTIAELLLTTTAYYLHGWHLEKSA